MCTTHRKIVAGEKLANFENPALFAKISLPLFTDIPKMYLAYALTVTYSPMFSLPIPLTCMYGLPKFSHVQYLYLNTSKSTCILLKYFSQNNATYLYLYFTKCQSTCTLIKYFHMYFAPCLLTMHVYVRYTHG